MSGYKSNRKTGKAWLSKAPQNPTAGAHPRQGSGVERCPFPHAREVQQQVLEMYVLVEGRISNPLDRHGFLRMRLPSLGL